MNLRNLTWQQVALSALTMAAVITVYKMFGEVPAGITMLVQSLLLASSTPGTPPTPPPGAN